jgi:hypothetical protein
VRRGTVKDDTKAEDNGARLAAAILLRNGLTVDKLYTHNHWIGLPDSIVTGAAKNCPVYILPYWADFKAKVKAYMAQYGSGAPDADAPEQAAALDNEPREWEKKAVEKAVARDILKGDAEGNMHLHEPATRADVLVFLERCGAL